jgi:hypothetical protein
MANVAEVSDTTFEKEEMTGEDKDRKKTTQFRCLVEPMRRYRRNPS